MSPRWNAERKAWAGTGRKHKVRLATRELQSAFSKGQTAARQGKRLAANPFRPCTDGDLWRAWNRGYADPVGTSKQTLARRNRRQAVIAEHGKTCWLCLQPIPDEELTLDHVRPRSKGGPTSRANLRPAHVECNVKRGNGPPPELLLTDDMRVELEAA